MAFDFLIAFFQGLFFLVLGSAFVVAEVVCFADNNREFFYHMIKKWWTARTYSKKKGQIPLDNVLVIKVSKKQSNTLCYNGKLDQQHEHEAFITIRDQLGCQMDMSVPLSLFEEFKQLLNRPSVVDVVEVNKQMPRADFNILLLTHYNKRIAEIENRYEEM